MRGGRIDLFLRNLLLFCDVLQKTMLSQCCSKQGEPSIAATALEGKCVPVLGFKKKGGICK